MEPELAELRDGRVLVIWRGSNTASTPGPQMVQRLRRRRHDAGPRSAN